MGPFFFFNFYIKKEKEFIQGSFSRVDYHSHLKEERGINRLF